LVATLEDQVPDLHEVLGAARDDLVPADDSSPASRLLGGARGDPSGEHNRDNQFAAPAEALHTVPLADDSRGILVRSHQPPSRRRMTPPPAIRHLLVVSTGDTTRRSVVTQDYCMVGVTSNQSRISERIGCDDGSPGFESTYGLHSITLGH